MAIEFTAPTGSGARVRVQKFGTFLSDMIMPNIPALIAWGIFTAFFIDVGWTPERRRSPRWSARSSTTCCRSSSPTPAARWSTASAAAWSARSDDGRDRRFRPDSWRQFNADLPAGDATARPGAHVHRRDDHGPARRPTSMKRLDALWDGKIKPGFEMLVNMFSAGILAASSWRSSGSARRRVVQRDHARCLGNAVNWLVDNDLLPLTSIFIEPAKVLFLNNAINHGVLTPLGIQRGRGARASRCCSCSRPTPAPASACCWPTRSSARGVAKATGPRRGDHPVLRRHPRGLLPLRADEAALILAIIAGGMTGVFDQRARSTSGLRAPAAPGSIFAVYAQTRQG